MMIALRLKDAALTALIAGILALPLAGVRTTDGLEGLAVEWHLTDVGVAVLLIFLGRLLLGLTRDGYAKFIAPFAVVCGIASAALEFPSHFLKTVAVAGSFIIALKAILHLLRGSSPTFVNASKRIVHASSLPRNLNIFALALLIAVAVFPITPLASRYALDVAVMVMTYIMLAWGLNITVGYAGLLDLGYAGFYALGAYSYALLAQTFGIGFWTALPIAGLIAAGTGLIVGLPVLRLRGDYFAIITLGFGEIVRLVLTNWTGLTNGPNGISNVPRPTFFGLEFAHAASDGSRTFNEFFGLEFEPVQRVILLYYIILALALLVGCFAARMRVLPLGRAWEALRENEIACAAVGVNSWWSKLAAYSMGAAVAGLAGAFFATRQGFISPESFTFTESATMLAIVILGGIGHPLGIVFAAIFIIGMPELFRGLEQYRMIAFGAGMVLIMIWRPGGLASVRTPTVRLGENQAPLKHPS